MLNEFYIPVSPNPYDEFTHQDAFCKVFTPSEEQIDYKDEINQDKLYFLNSTEETNQKKIITFEDFDQYYKRFTDIEVINEVEDINYENPSFFVSIAEEISFSSYENEKFVNVINPEYEHELKKKMIKEINEGIQETPKDKEFFTSNLTKSDTSGNDTNKTINYDISIDNKSKNLKKKKPEDIYFPFNPGKGGVGNFRFFEESYPPTSNNPNQNYIIPQNQEQECSINSGEKSLQSMNQENSDNINTEKNSGDINEEENSYYIEQIRNGNENFLFKFTTKKYFVLPNGKKRRIKKKRKFKSDDIRKKIKSRFHKTLKNIINANLRKAGSKKFFDFLPQCFIGNISKKVNSECLELTYKELLLTDFISKNNNEESQNRKIDKKKYLKNLEVVKYLEQNPEIYKNSGFDIIGDRKYKDLLKIYFSSAEFDDSIIRLKKENESKEYIQEYALKARTYVSFYENFGKKGNNVNDDDNSEE